MRLRALWPTFNIWLRPSAGFALHILQATQAVTLYEYFYATWPLLAPDSHRYEMILRGNVIMLLWPEHFMRRENAYSIFLRAYEYCA